MVGLYHILSRLGGVEEHRKLPQRCLGRSPQPQTLLGRFVRNSVRFYVCFSALWKLDVRDNNTKSRLHENTTAVGKVTLHVWTVGQWDF